jgi:hypothetical protein
LIGFFLFSEVKNPAAVLAELKEKLPACQIHYPPYSDPAGQK